MEPGSLTRRKFSWLALSLLGSSSFLLSGCGGLFGGGSGGTKGGSFKTVSGLVKLPSGVPASEIVVTSSGGILPLTSTAFTAQISEAAPSLLTAIHGTTYKAVSMGLADPAGDTVVLDSGSTAIALIYLAVGGAGLSGDDRKALLNAVAGSSEAASLKKAIDRAQTSDPFALTNGDAELRSAVLSATRSFSASWASHHLSNSKVSPSETLAIDPLLRIEPSSEVEGLTVVQTDPNLGFQVQNVRRRSGVAYTYMVGHTSASAAERDETPPKPVGQPLYVPSTKNLLSLPYGWAQVTSDPVALSVSGNDKKTKYETILLATSFNGTTPAIYSDPRYASMVQTWKDEGARLRQAGILQGIAELVLEVLGLGGTIFEYASLTALISQALTQTTAIASGLAAAASGNVFYEFVLEDLLTVFTAEAAFTLELPIIEPLIAQVSALRAAELFAGQTAANSIALLRAGMVVLIVLGIMEVADVLAVAHDTHGGNEANLWALTAFKPSVQLSPKDGEYVPGSSMTVTASAPGVGAQGVTYQWSLTGSNLANLSDGTHVGTSFTSDKSFVTLATTPSTHSDLTVTVTVLKNGETVGSASATYQPGSGLDIQFVEISYGPRFQFPAGGGYQIGYVEVPLQAVNRTLVEMHGTNNAPGYDGAKASIFVKMPPKSTPIYQIDEEIVAAQNISLGQLINEGNAYGVSFTDPAWTPDQAFRLVSYGDRILVWLGLTTWWNDANPDSGLPSNAGEALTRLQQALAQRIYNISIIG